MILSKLQQATSELEERCMEVLNCQVAQAEPLFADMITQIKSLASGELFSDIAAHATGWLAPPKKSLAAACPLTTCS